MKFFGKEVPPRSKPEAEHEHGIQPDEPIFREHPESLDVDSLVEAAQSGDAIDMVPELDEYYDGWIHYAQDRNLFIGAQQIKALSQARRESIDLAREKKFDELREKLAELSGPLAEDVESAAEANLKHIQESKETTHREHKEHLVEAVSEMEGLKATPAEEKEAGTSWNERAAKLAEQAPDERAAMDAAETAYLEKYKEYYRASGAKEKNEPVELHELRSAYNQSRSAYAKALEASMVERLDTHGTKLGLEGKREDVIRRYNSFVRFKAVVEPAAQKLYDARLEAMGQQEKGVFRKGLEWFGKSNAKLESKLGKNNARFARAAITTLVAGGIGAAVGTVGAAGALGVLGWGAWRFGRSVAAAFGGAAAGEGAAQLYGRTRGKRKLEAARADLKTEGKHGVSGLTAEELEAYDSTRLKLVKKADERTLEQKKTIIRALTAFGVGAGAAATAEILTHLPSAHGFVESVPKSGAPAPHPEVSPNPIHGNVAQHPETIAPIPHIESVSVHGNVNDADRLFGRFIDNVKAQVPNPESVPALRTLLEQYRHVGGMHQQDVLTRFLHLQNGGSVVVHPGDTVSFENGKVIFQGHTLIDEHGTLHNLRVGGQVHIQHPHAVPVTHEEVQQPTSEQPKAQATPPVSQVPQVEPQTTQSVPPSVEAAPVEPVPPPAEPEVPPSIEHAPSAPAIVPPEHAPTPTPEPTPEHVEQPAPAPIPEVAPAIPVEHAPAPEAPAYHVPVPSNDNVPVTETHAEPGHLLNHNGFDLSKPSVGMDPKGNLFAHIERTGNLDTDNELSYQTALKYATTHHDATVYYIDESRTAFGTPKYQVFALKFNPVTGQVWPTIPDTVHPDAMPPIPPGEELRNPTA